MKTSDKKVLLSLSTSTNITSIGLLGDNFGVVVGDMFGPAEPAILLC
jgi:hypothetical protein